MHFVVYTYKNIARMHYLHSRIRSRILIYSLTIGVSLFAGFVGALYTQGSLTDWYPFLLKPSWTPPGWVFGPVWTTLYILMGIAAGLVWSKPPTEENRFALSIFFVQLVVNAEWSVVFFGLRDLALSVLTILILDLVVLWLVLLFRKHSRVAAWLLVPYLAWSLFASVLNIAILYMNLNPLHS